jgi:putative ABC transport system substrate-binding protein
MSIRRRDFITLLGGAAAWPLGARAQQVAMPVIGFLASGDPDTSADRIAAFRRGLGEAGFVGGRNVAVEYRFAHNTRGRMAEFVAEMVRGRAAVIVAPTTTTAVAAKAATATIPIIFISGSDAVQSGLVTSLSRPDGNLTGINSMNVELGAKRLGLLHELLPRAQNFGLLDNPTVASFESNVASARAWAATLGRTLEVLTATSNREIDAAFERAVEKRVDAMMVLPAQLLIARRVQLATLAARHALPAIFGDRSFAQAGGLMSYAPDAMDQYRQVGIYVGRILKGEKPADLPVMQPTRFEFVINLQTAKVLGLTIPPTLLTRADEVIE